MNVTDLPTPAALIDLDVFERNITRMSARAHSLRVRLRPHTKTHKCAEGARRQIEGQFGGITVSTLREARFFADAGFHDVTYAFPLSIPRIPEAAELTRRVKRLSVLVDHDVTVDALESFAHSHAARFEVFLKVDCGSHRAGVEPRGSAGLRLARRLQDSSVLEFRGLLGHAGHAYACRDRSELRRVAAEERDLPARFAERLRASGVEVPEVSVGSTPTLSVAEDLSGVTEVRPGNYVFFDTTQVALGACAVNDIAFTVLSTVVSHYAGRNSLLIDAGALALSKDPGPCHINPECGFGRVRNPVGGAIRDDLSVESLTQEHGLLRATRSLDLREVPIGSRLEILPNHSCLTAALFDRYHVVKSGNVVDVWRPVRGW